jgi:hypothetical protein
LCDYNIFIHCLNQLIHFTAIVGVQQSKQHIHQEKGKKRVSEQEQAGYDFPTKVLKISCATSVKETLREDEMDISYEVDNIYVIF